MAYSNKKFNFIHGEHRKIFEKLKSQAKENKNRLWTAEEISKYQEDWGNLIKSMGKNGLSWKELRELLKVHDNCLENLKTVSNEKIAEISKAE
ncbi:MAG: hypothetical protein IJ859_06695, partial [Synergistaceae bacterium]|nr:hypothetical protein [Synergistaceae bacterium]